MERSRPHCPYRLLGKSGRQYNFVPDAKTLKIEFVAFSYADFAFTAFFAKIKKICQPEPELLPKLICYMCTEAHWHHPFFFHIFRRVNAGGAATDPETKRPPLLK